MKYEKQEFANWIDLAPSEERMFEETFKYFEELEIEMTTENANLEANYKIKKNLNSIYDLLKLEETIDVANGIKVSIKQFEYKNRKYIATKRKSSRTNQIEIREVDKFTSKKFNVISGF